MFCFILLFDIEWAYNGVGLSMYSSPFRHWLCYSIHETLNWEICDLNIILYKEIIFVSPAVSDRWAGDSVGKQSWSLQ